MLHTKARVLFLAALVMGVSGVATATPPATGLGQAWPNAVDVSVSPHYHVYSFLLNGVRYLQVNRLDGAILGAVGIAGDQFIVLPVGNAAQVSTPQQPATTTSTTSPSSTSEVVYQDASTVITATPQSDGTAALAATALACGDPTVCNSHGAAQAAIQ
jgi:hypothetical protein